MGSLPVIGSSYFDSGHDGSWTSGAGTKVQETFDNLNNWIKGYKNELSGALDSFLGVGDSIPVDALNDINTDINLDTSRLTHNANNLVSVSNKLESYVSEFNAISDKINSLTNGLDGDFSNIEVKINNLLSGYSGISPDLDYIKTELEDILNDAKNLLKGGDVSNLDAIESGLLTGAQRKTELKYQEDIYRLQREEFTRGYMLPNGFHIADIEYMNQNIAEANRVTAVQIAGEVASLVLKNKEIGATLFTNYVNNTRAVIETDLSYLQNSSKLLGDLLALIGKKYDVKTMVYKMQVELNQAVAQVYGEIVTALNTISTAFGTISELELKQQIEQIQSQLALEKEKIDANVKKGEFSLESLKSQANFLTTLVAGMVNAMNVSATISDSQREAIAHNDSISTIREARYSEDYILSNK